MDVAIFGGGCFWCLEAVYQKVRGVTSVTSGYMGGHVANPSYEEVCGKQTGHAEVVRIVFDPVVVSYEDLLAIFFTIHDATTPNRQGNDVGPQYRSVIFATTDAQMDKAQAVIGVLNRASALPIEDGGLLTRFGPMAPSAPVVTELIRVPSQQMASGKVLDSLHGRETAKAGQDVATIFWPAEQEHHNYFERHPYQGYCHFVVAPKVVKAQTYFSELMVN